MSRGATKIEDGGFPVYEEKHLRKVNAWRKAASMVNIEGPPILTKGQVLFSSAESAHDEPRSCFNCPFYYQDAGRCKLFGTRTKIYKFTEAGIEYWPVCGYWVYGKPEHGAPAYVETVMDPSDAGLIWINAPNPGLALSGSCCGGANDGDDCDYFSTEGREAKWDATSGHCRVLQLVVGSMDCCSAWQDDDALPFQTAAQFLKDKP